MSRHWIILVLALLFMLETAVVPWLIPPEWHMNIRIAPHLVLVGIVYAAVFFGRHYALVLGLVFGFVHDLIFYGHMIGLYMSGTGLIAYFAGLLFHRVRPTFFTVQSAAVLALIVFDVYIFAIYRLFNVVTEPFTWAALHYMLPSVLFNLFFSLAVYVPFRQIAEKALFRDKKED